MCIPHLEIFTEKREVEVDVAGARVAQKKNKKASPVSSVPATVGSRGSKEMKFPFVVLAEPIRCCGSSSTTSSSSGGSGRSSSDSSSSSGSSGDSGKKDDKKDKKYRYPSKSSRRPSNRLNAGHYKTKSPILRPMAPSDIWQVATGQKAVHRLNPVGGSGIPMDCLSDNGTVPGYDMCTCENCMEREARHRKKHGKVDDSHHHKRRDKKDKKHKKSKDKKKDDEAADDGWGNDSKKESTGWNDGKKEDDVWPDKKNDTSGWVEDNNKDDVWDDDKKDSGDAWGDDNKNGNSVEWGDDKDDKAPGTWGDDKDEDDGDGDGWGHDDRDDKGKKGKGKKGKGKKGNKTDDETDRTGNEKGGKGGKDKKGQSKKDDTSGKHHGHAKHHHHHHGDDNRAVTVRVNSDIPEVINEEGSESAPLDSVHSPNSVRSNTPHITIASRSPGCVCSIGGSTTTSSAGSSIICPSCYIKQQTPRNYVQDLQGHWYRFAPGIDVNTYDKDDIFRGSDGRAYRRISSKKVPQEEFYYRSGQNHSGYHGQRHNSHYPQQGVPTTTFMKFKKVFNKPTSIPQAAYRSAGTVPVYGIPVQTGHNDNRSSGWQGVFRLFTGSSASHSARHRGGINQHHRSEPPSSYSSGSRCQFNGYRPPDGTNKTGYSLDKTVTDDAGTRKLPSSKKNKVLLNEKIYGLSWEALYLPSLP
ncbi:hypothetical protein TWF730_004006 [Orbilia blumenaviensis]|uniref:Uncharacterized protein n=1 Tax=Orbilia blumenaviensis TaxID=1796055 RepID=A0AAV9U587_9PEZI